MKYYKGKKAQAHILAGVKHVHDFVSPTMGAKGQHVLLDPEMGRVFAVNDGATITKFTGKFVNDKGYPTNQLEARAAGLVAQAAINASERSGDGTTLTTVLYYNLLKEAYKLTKRHSNVFVSNKLEELLNASKVVLERIKNEFAKTLNDKEVDMGSIVAQTSTKDKELAKWVNEANKKAGKYGVVQLKQFVGSKSKYNIDSKTGYILPGGIQHASFVNSPTNEIIHENIELLLIDGETKLADAIFQKIGNFVVANKDKKFAIVSHGWNAKTIEALIPYKDRVIPVLLVGQTSNDKAEQINDLILLNGEGKSYTTNEIANGNGAFQTIKVKRLVQNGGMTIVTMFDNDKQNDGLSKRIKFLEDEIKSGKLEEGAKSALQQKLQRLTTGFHTLEIYGETQFIVKDRYERAMDGIKAIRSANEHGVLPGGGNALLYVANELKNFDVNVDESVKKLAKALEAPFKQIAKNAGIKVKKEMIERVAFDYVLVLNLDNGKLQSRCDVIDSYETVLVALELVIQDVATLVRTFGAIVDETKI